MCDEAHTDAVAPEEVTLEPVVTLEGGARPDGAGSTSDGASGGSSGTWGSSWFKGLKAPAGGGGTLGSLSLGGNLAQTWGASMRKGGEALRERMAAAVKDVQVGTSNNLEAASAHAAQLKGSLLTSFTGPTPQYVALRLPPSTATSSLRVCARGCTRRAADAACGDGSSGEDQALAARATSPTSRGHRARRLPPIAAWSCHRAGSSQLPLCTTSQLPLSIARGVATPTPTRATAGRRVSTHTQRAGTRENARGDWHTNPHPRDAGVAGGAVWLYAGRCTRTAAGAACTRCTR